MTRIDPAFDCKHFRGDRPCQFKQRCQCEHYAPMGRRIVIIKLGALGDVVRTASLLPSLKREYPISHITWVSKPSGVRILSGHPQIDQLMTFDAETMLTLPQETFDLVLSLDKESGPTALCNAINCPDKRGIGLSRFGTPEPLNDAAGPYFLLGLDDDLKFHHNRKSYPQLIHDALALPYIREPYRLYPNADARRKADAMFEPWRAGSSAIIGLNTGSGAVFANKAPTPARWAQIARRLIERGYEIALLGGPSETATNTWIAKQVGPSVHDTGGANSEQDFIAIVSRCDAVIAGDTLALHVAVSRRVPVVALFGPTCEQEIDLFGAGRKIVSDFTCGPCYSRDCRRCPSCTDSISVEQIVDALETACPARSEQAAV